MELNQDQSKGSWFDIEYYIRKLEKKYYDLQHHYFHKDRKTAFRVVEWHQSLHEGDNGIDKLEIEFS